MSQALTLRGLNVGLRGPDRVIPVVKDVSLELPSGSITGLAGESGCGKSLTALALMGLNDAHTFHQRLDQLSLGQENLLTPEGNPDPSARGHQLAMIFQDPSTSLDPVMRVGHQIELAIARQPGQQRSKAHTRSLEALESVGFTEPESTWKRYPYQLSGGMRQLVVIAMAQAVNPRVLIADEPTTALDMSTQTLVMDRLHQLVNQQGTAVLLITHDLRLLARHAETVLIMYHGRIVEKTRGENLFHQAQHPYTHALAAALPRMDRPAGELPSTIPGQVPQPGQSEQGCAFAPRCRFSEPDCVQQQPALQGDGNRAVACHYPQRRHS